MAAPARCRFNLAKTRLRRSTSRQTTRRLSTKRSIGQVRMSSQFDPEARARRSEADDAAVALDDDGAQVVGVFGERCASFRVVPALASDEAPLHDVLRLLDQIKIDVALLRDAMAAMAQFDRIDRLADQRAPDAGRDGDRDDHGNDDGVVARHFEHHDDRRHDAAGSRADHRGHADDRGRGKRQARMRKDMAHERRRRRRPASRRDRARAKKCRRRRRSRG